MTSEVMKNATTTRTSLTLGPPLSHSQKAGCTVAVSPFEAVMILHDAPGKQAGLILKILYALVYLFGYFSLSNKLTTAQNI